MHRIDTPTAQRDKFGQGKNGFTRGNPQTGTPATQLDYMYCDAIQEEIANVIESAGFTLDKLKHNQLSLSISELIKKGVNAGEYLPAIKINSNCYCVNSHVVIKDMVGDQRLMPFRRDELPFGWYSRNGDNFLLDSPQGQALNGLSANYKRDHNITIKTIDGKQYINAPTAFAPDGRGYFERAVDGTNRQVGSVEGDAIRDIWGHFDTGVVPHHDEYTSGAFFGTTAINPKNTAFQSSTAWPTCGFDFYASRVVPTAHENRPINIGLTPTIYLGV